MRTIVVVAGTEVVDMSVLEQTQELPELPEDWVSADTQIWAWARRNREGTWEAVYPWYSVVGRGSSFPEARREAAEMLSDYFRMCVADGMTFDQATRPVSLRWALREILASMGGVIALQVRGRVSRIYRTPASPQVC